MCENKVSKTQLIFFSVIIDRYFFRICKHAVWPYIFRRIFQERNETNIPYSL